MRGCRERHTIRREGSRGCRRAWHGGVGRIASGEKSAWGASCNIVCLLVGRVEQGGAKEVGDGDCHQGSGTGAACPRRACGRRRGSWLAARPQPKADDRGEQSSMASELDPTGAGRGGQRAPAECARGSRWRRRPRTGDTERRAGEAASTSLCWPATAVGEGGRALQGAPQGAARLPAMWVETREQLRAGAQPLLSSTNPVSCASSAVVAKERSARPGSRAGEPHRRGEGQRRTIGPGQQGRHTVRHAGVPSGWRDGGRRGGVQPLCTAKRNKAHAG